jgi:hypothetical protein
MERVDLVRSLSQEVMHYSDTIETICGTRPTLSFEPTRDGGDHWYARTGDVNTPGVWSSWGHDDPSAALRDLLDKVSRAARSNELGVRLVLAWVTKADGSDPVTRITLRRGTGHAVPVPEGARSVTVGFDGAQ